MKSTEDVEPRWFDRIRHIGQGHLTAFLFCHTVRILEPPLLVSEAIFGRWLRDHGGINVWSKVNNAAHLERDWNARIREHLAGAGIEPAELAKWMRATLAVSVPTRVCQHWLTRDWASSGVLLVSDAVESALGDKLRLDEYKQSFVDEAVLCHHQYLEKLGISG